MSVGGKIISIDPFQLEDGRVGTRLWVLDMTYGDETADMVQQAKAANVRVIEVSA